MKHLSIHSVVNTGLIDEIKLLLLMSIFEALFVVLVVFAVLVIFVLLVIIVIA